jgi:hypothetical protein
MLNHFRVSTTIDASAERVWRYLTDTHTWHQWGPSVKKVRCVQRYISEGAAGQILTPLGIWLPFQIQQFEAPHFWDWRVAGVSATGHRVEPTGENRCLLTFTVPWWSAPYLLICRQALARIRQTIERYG